VLCEILGPRVEELFTLSIAKLSNPGWRIPFLRVVLTGGSSILEGMPELAEQIFNLPVRRGTPQHIGGLVDVVNSPVYATGVGLVVYGSTEFRRPGVFR
jgi:cell division protein FtsA